MYWLKLKMILKVYLFSHHLTYLKITQVLGSDDNKNQKYTLVLSSSLIKYITQLDGLYIRASTQI